MIELRNVSLIKNGTALFEDLSCQFDDGENYLIAGANGSGKTLLLEVIAGAFVSKGEVHYSFIQEGTWDTRHREKQNTIKFITAHALQSLLPGQSSHYYQQRYYSDQDNDVDDVATALDISAEKIASLNLPASLSIAHLLRVKITRLSNGQLRKVLLVRALLGNIPRVLLLDYPFEGLDPQSREDLSQFLWNINKAYGIQIIMTDHHHRRPSVITRQLTIDHFKIISDERLPVEMDEPIQPNLKVPPRVADDVPIIEIHDLGVRYGAKQILEHFNWTVRKGERWALVGRNGAGKTTLFSVIFADHPVAYAQKVFLFGKRRGSGESIWDIKKRIAYLGPELLNFTDPGSVSATAREFLIGSGCNAASTGALVEYFHADNFIDLPVRSLSSGQLQLMEVIRCFVSKKELLLMDEPFQYLDRAVRDRVRDYLRTMLDEHVTLILITHDERDIPAWTDKIIRL